VLRPGGSLYVKDVFRREQLWSAQESLELAEFDRVYQYCTRSLEACVRAAATAGFTAIATRDLTDHVSIAHTAQAMVDARDGTLSAFGRLHHRRYACLPVYFAELTAVARPRDARGE
jgi:hypothetical protein